MMRNVARVAVAVLALAMPAFAQSDRTAEQILKDFEAAKIPDRPQDAKDRAANLEYIEAVKKVLDRRIALVGELYKVDPKNPELKKLLPQRWLYMASTPEQAKEVVKEIDEALSKVDDPATRLEILFFKPQIQMRFGEEKPEVIMAGVKAYLAHAAKGDDRGAQLLFAVARSTEDEAERKKLEDRILADFADSSVAGYIKGMRRQREAVGKPFDLEFVDAINGSNVSIKGLKGKVVVIDFWATWCGPCVAEMPKMKELYQKYKDQGVEFIGVSLDNPKEEGGLDKLKAFVKDNEIGWPQYYQGNGWKSEFSSSWGVTGIPCVFVVNHEGNLATTEGRGQLEELIPELLKKAKGAGSSGGE